MEILQVAGKDEGSAEYRNLHANIVLLGDQKLYHKIEDHIYGPCSCDQEI